MAQYPPSQDAGHWDLIEYWNFKTMSMGDLTNDWSIMYPYGNQAPGYLPEFHEPAFYESDNVSLSPTTGLNLLIEAETQTQRVKPTLSDGTIMSDGLPNLRTEDYTEAHVQTLAGMHYGYVEARIKVPYGYNFHAGFWMFTSVPVGGGCENEIDIFEMVPMNSVTAYPNNNNIQKTNIHCAGVTSSEDITISDYTQYHTYGLEWSPTEIIWYFDDVVIRILPNPGLFGTARTILNFSLNPIPDTQSVNTGATAIPSTMMIDYVKWYQLDMNCTALNACSYNFATHVPEVRSSIDIGGAGCVNSITSGSNVTLRAPNTTISGTFTVPANTTFAIINETCY